jgi:hypothetical protein
MTVRGRYTGPIRKIVPLDYIQWDLTPNLPETVPAEGLMYWNEDDGTLNLGMPGGNVNLQIGQEMIFRARNETGGTLTNGTVVYISGASGKPLVSKADANEANADMTLAITTESIDHNSNGYVTVFGMVRGINTSGWSAGDPLYLSETAGEIVNVAPAKPAHIVRVGYALDSTADGTVLATIQIGSDLSGLHDVSLSSEVHGDVLTYNNDTTLWENHTLTHVGTDAPTSPSTQVVGRIWLDTDESVPDRSTYTLRKLSTSQTLLTTDMIIIATGTITLTLPVSATTDAGKTIWIKNAGTGVITVDGNGAETIDDGADMVLAVHESITVTNDQTEWWII